MKSLNKFLFCFLAIICSHKLMAQDETTTKDYPVTQVIDVNIDKLGNANLTSTQKYNAMAWNAVKQSMGNNTALYKSYLQRAMPKYFLDNFKYTEEEMDRTNHISFTVAGMAHINQDGKWQLDMDEKNPDITQTSGGDFIMKLTLNENGSDLPQTQKLKLPPGASNAKIDHDSFGNAILTYSLPNGKFVSILLTVLGGLVALFGVWLLINRNKNKPQTMKVVATPQSPVTLVSSNN